MGCQGMAGIWWEGRETDCCVHCVLFLETQEDSLGIAADSWLCNLFLLLASAGLGTR